MAATDGAQIILAPEMAVSGNSFKSRSDIADYIEEEKGPFISALKRLTEEFKMYICVGLGLKVFRILRPVSKELKVGDSTPSLTV